MEIVLFWFLFAVIVGVAANTRGRSGLGWFLLAVVISPLIAGLFVLALPRLSPLAPTSSDVGPIHITRTPEVPIAPEPSVFEPDGAYGGVPYKVQGDGSIEAIMQGARVRFRTIDQFKTAVGGPTLR